MICVITGPSGSGKTSVISSLVGDIDIQVIEVATTRAARDESSIGRSHVSEETFASMEREMEFVETVEYDSSKYGIPRSTVEKVKSPFWWLLDYPGDYPRLTATTAMAQLRLVVLAPSEKLLIKRLVTSGRTSRIDAAREEYREVLEEISTAGEMYKEWHLVYTSSLVSASREIRKLMASTSAIFKHR